MSTTQSPGAGGDEARDTERPEGTVDTDANPPLTDDSTTDIDRKPETVPPQDTGSAVPPHEGRQRSSDDNATPGRGENEVSANTGVSGKTATDQGSGRELDDEDEGVGPSHAPGTGRAEDKS
jgi:hypothetical protein